MNIKEYSKQVNLTLSQVKKLCQEVLGIVPTELTEEQQQQLLDASNRAADSLALPQASQSLDIQTQNVRAIVTDKKLAANAGLYRRLLGEFLSREAQIINQGYDALRQYHRQETASLYNDLSRNLLAVQGEFNVPQAIAGNYKTDPELLDEILALELELLGE